MKVHEQQELKWLENFMLKWEFIKSSETYDLKGQHKTQLLSSKKFDLEEGHKFKVTLKASPVGWTMNRCMTSEGHDWWKL